MPKDYIDEIDESMLGDEDICWGGFSCEESTEDWGFTLDDQGTGFWEDYLGGPDDKDIERLYETYHYNDELKLQSEDDSDDEAMYSEIEKDYLFGDIETTDMQENLSRQEEIVNWLSKSILAAKLKSLRHNSGFCVLKGPLVRLKDGSLIEIIEWLRQEDIYEADSIGDYCVFRFRSESGHRERLFFIKMIVEVPFFPKKSNNEQPQVNDTNIIKKDAPDVDFEDDIPF
jgi:hypothetical protein